VAWRGKNLSTLPGFEKWKMEKVEKGSNGNSEVVMRRNTHWWGFLEMLGFDQNPGGTQVNPDASSQEPTLHHKSRFGLKRRSKGVEPVLLTEALARPHAEGGDSSGILRRQREARCGMKLAGESEKLRQRSTTRRHSNGNLKKGGRTMKAAWITAVVMAVMAWGLSPCTAEVPRTINYQGQLNMAEGEPVDSTILMVFRIYADSVSQDPLWEEIQEAVEVTDGLFNVLLGSVTPISEQVFNGSERYLGLTVGNDDEMQPRRPLVSVVYAYHTLGADVADLAMSVSQDAVGTEQIADGAIEFADIGNNQASPGQVIKWSDAKAGWVAGEDETGGISEISGGAGIVVSGGPDLVEVSIADGGVTSSMLAGNSVTSDKMDAGAVATDKLSNGAVTNDKLSSSAVTNDKLAMDAVTNDKLSSSAVTNEKLASDAVTNDKLSIHAVTSEKLNANAVSNEKIQVNAVTSDKIADATIQFADIGQNAASPGQVIKWSDAKAGWVAGEDETGGISEISGGAGIAVSGGSDLVEISIADGGVTNIMLSGNSVTSDKIGDGEIKTADLDAGAVATDKLSNGAVTNDKLSSSAVTNDKLAMDAVTNDKLSSSAVTNEKLASDAVTNDKLSIHAVTSEKLNANAVTAEKIQSGAVTSDKIADATIQFSDIGQNAATAGQVMKWNGTNWSAANDEIGSDLFLPLAGGEMTGAVTNTGDPPITMGKGNFGTENLNPGTQAFAAGSYNRARGDFSVVSGGGGTSPADSNSAFGDWSVIGGGENNTAIGEGATVGGGKGNVATNPGATISGGTDNTASGAQATVGGGNSNTASGLGTPTVGGGNMNTASGSQATVGGGDNNMASQLYATVGGGHENIASGEAATIGGGEGNTASGQHSVVSGGGNSESADPNVASGDYSIVGGGRGNVAGGEYAIVAGGSYNEAEGSHSVVSGGGGPGHAYSNVASGDYSVVSGGNGNVASGEYATVAGGRDNHARGSYSFAAGRGAETAASHMGTFVWSDGSLDQFESSNDKQFLINASGGVGIGTNHPQGALDVSSTTGAFIVPRMTQAQRNALSAVNGMIIYNTSTNRFNFYENGAWVTK
jgi:hypothetical protein